MGNFGSKETGPSKGKGNNKRRNVCSKHLCVLCDKRSPALDDHLRAIGNDLFRSGRYQEALEIYSAIIEHNDSNPTSYTNRANTHMRLKQFNEALADCTKALSLAPEALKANYYTGQCLCELKRYDEGFAHLKKALSMSRREGGKHEREVLNMLAGWQQKRRQELEEIQKEKDLYLKLRLVQLIIEEKKRQTQAMKDACQAQQSKRGLLTRFYSKELRDNIANVSKSYDDLIGQVEQTFEKLSTSRERHEVPEFMCCKISLALMEDPVVTPSGITYDRRVIEEHLRRGNNFDPTTREPLTMKDLIPNLALKDAIEEFASKGNWDFADDGISMIV